MASEDPSRLHSALRAYYNRDAAYFAEAAEANRELSPERAGLFGWIQDGERVLDVGCGSGDNGRHLGPRVRYVGLDISHLALARGLPRFPAGGGAVQGESQRLPFADGAFEAVLSTYALEHFVYPRETLEEMWRVCHAGGRVILISPAYDDPRLLPPSTGHWPWFRRAWWVAGQAWRQGMRHLDRRRFYFTRIAHPRILDEAYRSDYDAVHLVSAREIGNFFRALGAAVLFERRRRPRPVPAEASLARGVRERLRNLALRCGWGEYAGLNLQLVARKEP